MDLSVTLKGQTHDLTLKNPVLTASGTFGYGLEFASYGDLAALGGMVAKGLSLLPRQGNATPRIVETTAGMLNAVGLQNDGVEVFCKDKLPRLPWQETAVIANIYAGSVEEFAELAARLNEEEGVAALEVNVSCPNVKEGGVAFGTKPESVYRITKAVRAHCTKPLMVKLSPNVADIAEVAKAAQEGGADAISLINTLTGMAVDIRTRRPVLANVVGGMSGPAVRPVALRMCWQAAKAVTIPVVGMGGIETGADAIAFLMVGCTAVQVGTANLYNPYACMDVVKGMEEYCAQYGIDDIRQVVNSLILD